MKSLKSISGSFFNTEISVTASCDADVLDKVADMCGYYERLFSKTLPDSDVWNINHAEGRAVPISSHTQKLIAMALKMYGETGGCYNIALGSAIKLWKFNTAEARLPDEGAIAEALSNADCGKIKLSGDRVTVPEGMELDLGSMAKGYIADEIGRYLRSVGVLSALINLGGNVLTVGRRPDGQKWKVGLQYPDTDRSRRGDYWAVMQSADNSIVTSGSYERGFRENGRWYHHILDPRTGFPCDNGVLSVTLCSNTSFIAEALSTPLFLLGPEKGLCLAEKYDSSAAFFMSDGSVLCTDAFMKHINP